MVWCFCNYEVQMVQLQQFGWPLSPWSTLQYFKCLHVSILYLYHLINSGSQRWWCLSQWEAGYTLDTSSVYRYKWNMPTIHSYGQFRPNMSAFRQSEETGGNPHIQYIGKARKLQKGSSPVRTRNPGIYFVC